MAKAEKTHINNYPHHVTFRLDDAAFAALTEAANSHGLTVNAFARELTTRGANIQAKLPETKIRTVAASGLAEMKVELVKQGTNLNQIARAVNQANHSALALMPDWFRQSRALLDLIADALGTTRDP